MLAETCRKNVILWNVELCIRRKHAYQRTLMVVLRGRRSTRELQFFRTTEGGNATSLLRHNCYVTRRRCAMSGPSDSESCQFLRTNSNTQYCASAAGLRKSRANEICNGCPNVCRSTVWSGPR